MPSVIAEIARAVLAALDDGEPVVTATVIRAPQGAEPAVGAKLLVRLDGSTVGSLGGGAIEAVVREACLEQAPLHDTRLLRLDSSGIEASGRHTASVFD